MRTIGGKYLNPLGLLDFRVRFSAILRIFDVAPHTQDNQPGISSYDCLLVLLLYYCSELFGKFTICPHKNAESFGRFDTCPDYPPFLPNCQLYLFALIKGDIVNTKSQLNSSIIH